MLERLFRLRENQTTPLREAGGGLTTFLAMAYIIFVNPAVLSQAGMDFGAVMTATCLSAAAATLVMGLAANYPIAMAPAMGENFFFLTVVIGMGVPWRSALAAVFLSGVLFFLLTLLRVREAIISAVPASLKHAIAIGIGLFIIFIGLVQSGVVVRQTAGNVVPVRLGDLSTAPALLALGGTALAAALAARGFRAAVLLAILATALAGVPLGIVRWSGLVSSPPSLAPTFLQMDLRSVADPLILPAVLIFLYMAVFDAIGTLIGIGQQGGFMREGRLPRAGRALMADATGTVVGATLGTSTVTAYIESAAGVQQGARTGLANVTTAALFLGALFFAPLARTIGGGYDAGGGVILYPVTAPALILVGCFMARNVSEIDWKDLTEAIPAILVMVGMPLTWSIADGLAFGFIGYPLIKLLAGRGREVPALIHVIGALFVLRYALI